MTSGLEHIGANGDANRRAADRLEIRERSAGEKGLIVAQTNAGAEQVRQIHWQRVRLNRFEFNQDLNAKKLNRIHKSNYEMVVETRCLTRELIDHEAKT